MIPVRNVYYMLAYAFSALCEKGYRALGEEDFPNTEELLAAILCRGVSGQIKRGLCRQYIPLEESLTSPRGKIEITESIRTRSMQKKQLVCIHDEFSVNAYRNRVLKTTMVLLLKSSIGKERKKELRQLLLFFEGVDMLDKRRIQWNLPYDRNNQTYRMLMAICRLLIEGLLPSTADGTARMMHYEDDGKMSKLYEKFILGYYKKEHPDLQASSPQVPWQVTDGFRAGLPTMKTDVVLANRKTGKTLIIDAKYYKHSMQSRYETRTVHSGNIYQIFTYVKNWKTQPGETVSGMLLYARTDEAVQPDGDYQISGNTISVKTLDLNREFPEIARQLDAIAERVRTSPAKAPPAT